MVFELTGQPGEHFIRTYHFFEQADGEKQIRVVREQKSCDRVLSEQYFADRVQVDSLDSFVVLNNGKVTVSHNNKSETEYRAKMLGIVSVHKVMTLQDLMDEHCIKEVPEIRIEDEYLRGEFVGRRCFLDDYQCGNGYVAYDSNSKPVAQGSTREMAQDKAQAKGVPVPMVLRSNFDEYLKMLPRR